MSYIKINETMYPAAISGNLEDRSWDKRDSKSITLEMDYATAINLFVDGAAWSIIHPQVINIPCVDENGEAILDENGNQIIDVETRYDEFDNSDYCVAGSITDNRDGTLTIKMGKFTIEEMLLMEVLG